MSPCEQQRTRSSGLGPMADSETRRSEIRTRYVRSHAQRLLASCGQRFGHGPGCRRQHPDTWDCQSDGLVDVSRLRSHRVTSLAHGADRAVCGAWKKAGVSVMGTPRVCRVRVCCPSELCCFYTSTEPNRSPLHGGLGGKDPVRGFNWSPT